jgi:hypothetical protein
VIDSTIERAKREKDDMCCQSSPMITPPLLLHLCWLETPKRLLVRSISLRQRISGVLITSGKGKSVECIGAW